MELVFDIDNPHALERGTARSCVFGEDGGIIGRHSGCEWSIEDRQRLVSGRHAEIGCRNGQYFLIDVSRNGIERVDGEWLRKGEEAPILHGSAFRVGGLVIVAQVSASGPDGHSWQLPVQETADDPDLRLDLLAGGTGSFESPYSLLDDIGSLLCASPGPHQAPDHTPADRDHVLLPRLVPEPDDTRDAATARADIPASTASFWQRVGTVLEVDLQTMTAPDREAMVLAAVQLLKRCVGGLHHALRNRDDLQREICGVEALAGDDGKSPFEAGADAGTTLRDLLLTPSRLAAADEGIPLAFRQLQAHQLALVAASRAVSRAALDHFSPQQLNWEFERDSSRPIINTAGSRWRAYLRFHHLLSRTDEWADELFSRHFVQAYRDQIRLLDTLHLDWQE